MCDSRVVAATWDWYCVQYGVSKAGRRATGIGDRDGNGGSGIKQGEATLHRPDRSDSSSPQRACRSVAILRRVYHCAG